MRTGARQQTSVPTSHCSNKRKSRKGAAPEGGSGQQALLAVDGRHLQRKQHFPWLQRAAKHLQILLACMQRRGVGTCGSRAEQQGHTHRWLDD